MIGSCVAASCVGVEYGLIYPTIYPYLRELGAHPTIVTGVAAAAFSLAKTAAFVPLGAAADRFGPRKPAVIAFLVASIGNVYYFAASKPLDIVVARAIVGLGSSVTGVLLGVVGSGDGDDSTMRRKRDLRLAVFNGTSLIAVLAGPGLAALFSVLPEGEHQVFDIDAYSAPGLFLAALALLCAVWALLALPATPPAQRRASGLRQAPPRRRNDLDLGGLAAMASRQCHAASTPSTWPSESLRVAAVSRRRRSTQVGEGLIEREPQLTKPARDVRDALITRRAPPR